MCGQSFFTERHFTVCYYGKSPSCGTLHSISYYACQSTLSYSQSINEKPEKVLSTLDTFQAFFHFPLQNTFQALSDLLSPSCARVWLVKMLQVLQQSSEHLRSWGVTMPTGSLLGSLIRALSHSSLSCPLKDQMFLLQRPGLHGYCLICTSAGSFMSLWCSRLQ